MVMGFGNVGADAGWRGMSRNPSGAMVFGDGLLMSLLMDGDRLVGTAVRRFCEERGRYQKQGCKRQQGREWSIQTHSVLRGAERQSNSYLRESLLIV